MLPPRLVCASCSVVGAGTACPKCGGELSAPSAFDCAKLGLLPELQELVQQVKRRKLSSSTHSWACFNSLNV